MNKGDYVMISPDLTAMKGWVKGQIIDVEDNPFNGKVISAQTEDGNIYFGVVNLFKPAA
ncbi:MAG: transcriptional regulator [Paludibacteraceae bacterium]|nr:transcriptional regulator [Paludibacteraceae bacterium]